MQDYTSYKPGDTITHKSFGEGRIISVLRDGDALKWEVEFDEGTKKIVPTPQQFVGSVTELGGLTFDDVKQAVRDVLKEDALAGDLPEIGEKWYNGKLIMIPGKEGLQPKEIPINALFHKIVMIRDRLRVMEQRINSHSLLDDQEKVNLQQYITKIYGSLTTFNVLFRDKKEQFIGEKS